MIEPNKRETGKEAMGMAAFLTLLEQYGAESRRWPDSLREDAAALLATSELARAAHRRAEILDDALNSVSQPSLSQERVARVVAGALAELPVPGLVRQRRPFTAQVREWIASWSGLWPKAAGLAACTAAGILVGSVMPVTGSTGAGTSNVAAADLPNAMFTPSPLESLFQ